MVGKEVSGCTSHDHTSVENNQEWTERCEEGCSRFLLRTEEKGVILIPSMVVPKIGKRYLPWFSTEGAAL